MVKSFFKNNDLRNLLFFIYKFAFIEKKQGPSKFAQNTIFLPFFT